MKVEGYFEEFFLSPIGRLAVEGYFSMMYPTASLEWRDDYCWVIKPDKDYDDKFIVGINSNQEDGEWFMDINKENGESEDKSLSDWGIIEEDTYTERGFVTKIMSIIYNKMDWQSFWYEFKSPPVFNVKKVIRDGDTKSIKYLCLKDCPIEMARSTFCSEKNDLIKKGLSVREEDIGGVRTITAINVVSGKCVYSEKITIVKKVQKGRYTLHHER